MFPQSAFLVLLRSCYTRQCLVQLVRRQNKTLLSVTMGVCATLLETLGTIVVKGELDSTSCNACCKRKCCQTFIFMLHCASFHATCVTTKLWAKLQEKLRNLPSVTVPLTSTCVSFLVFIYTKHVSISFFLLCLLKEKILPGCSSPLCPLNK